MLWNIVDQPPGMHGLHKEYSFFDLDSEELLNFISKCNGKYEFEIYNNGGRLIKSNKGYDYLEVLVSDN